MATENIPKAGSFGAGRMGGLNTVLGKHGLGEFSKLYALDFGIRVLTGEGVGHAAVHAVGSAALWTAFPHIMIAQLGYAITKGAISAGYASSYANQMKYRSFVSRQIGGTYRDNQMSQTMRQRAIQEIQGSKMNARNMLGQEALMVHRRRYEY